tara:strand:- start:316 stop:1317 length:1002 start_codon:yes stop_codon:yes gene_type:complete
MHLNFNLPKKILAWYDNNKRDLPWRVSKKSKKNLYYRLLSEFMLQQTQVKTVLPYFKKFLLNFPTIDSLSESKEKKILKLWEGLGYYRRARNLLASSKIIVRQYKSKLPKEYKDIIKLPGIGDYTANALLAFVYNEPTLAIDGNVKRVFSRILNKNESKIDFKKIIDINKKKLFKSKRNSDLAEAIMEFGALVCKPKEPDCSGCDLKTMCKYFKSKNKYIKTPKTKPKVKSYNIFCYINQKNQIALTKKHKFGFLNNFYLPPMQEVKSKNLSKNWKYHSNFKNLISNKILDINLYYKHTSKNPFHSEWFSLKNNYEFIPSFTKRIFKQILKTN